MKCPRCKTELPPREGERPRGGKPVPNRGERKRPGSTTVTPEEALRADAPPDDADLRTGLAVALRRADADLAQQLTAAVDALRAEGRFDAIAARHGLPRVAPP